MSPPVSPPALRICHLGCVDYLQTWQRMRRFTQEREAGTPDELWMCEHGPVYTQGVAGKPEHLLDSHGIPVVQTDRGGQVTYHGPGQVVAYPLVDLRRLGIYVKEYVFRLEAAVLQVLESYGVTGHRVPGAPGIYARLGAPDAHPAPAAPARDLFTGLGKIAALGIKVSQHCTYHGVALNVAMDLEPFARINPCGYPGLATVDLVTLGVAAQLPDAAQRLGERLAAHLGP
jgi:lipoyl(octanoyl) transferase